MYRAQHSRTLGCQPAHAGRRIERLGDGDERHLVRVQNVDQFAKSISDRESLSIL
jgi:hypothetical protein